MYLVCCLTDFSVTVYDALLIIHHFMEFLCYLYYHMYAQFTLISTWQTDGMCKENVCFQYHFKGGLFPS